MEKLLELLDRHPWVKDGFLLIAALGLPVLCFFFGIRLVLLVAFGATWLWMTVSFVKEKAWKPVLFWIAFTPVFILLAILMAAFVGALGTP
jgi:hypothetical protein